VRRDEGQVRLRVRDDGTASTPAPDRRASGCVASATASP
jgi:hypothetical protein